MTEAPCAWGGRAPGLLLRPVMSSASTNRMLRSAVLLAAVLLVTLIWRKRLQRDAAPDIGPAVAKASASAPTPSGSASPLAVAAASSQPQVRSLADAGGPVYLRLNELKLVHPAPHVRGHLRVDVNATYYDYPSEPSDAGPGWVELGDSTHGKYFAIPRSVSYEIFFELALPHGQVLSGAAETLNLTSASGTLSDKVPFTEEYPLYYTGHGMRAAEPTAIVSYTITETP